MVKHNFKVGDKVRLKDPKVFPHLGTKILTVIDFSNKFANVRHKGMIKGAYFPLYPCEIEHIIKVGEQLLFAFMDN